MVLPPGGFLTLGLLLLFFSWVKERKERLAERLAQADEGAR
jgi:electron transport complex protein RnfE